MSWTTEYPTKPGFYWIKFANRQSPEVVFLDPEMGIHLIGNSERQDRSLAAEWQGPIEPDTEKPISPMCYSSIKIACRECGETDKRSFVSWKVGEADGKPMYGIICRDCWIKRLTPEQRKVYMV